MAAYDITAFGSALEFDTTAAFSKQAVPIPGTDWIAIAWYRSTTVVNVQVFSVNRSTGAVTALGSPFDIEGGTSTDTLAGIAIVAIDASNLAVFWTGPGNDGFCRLLSVDGSGNVSGNGSILEYETSFSKYPRAILWDSTHILAVWTGNSGGASAIFTINTGTGSISVTGTPLALGNFGLSELLRLNSTKALIAYNGQFDDGFMRVLDINTSTWAVTAAGSAFEFEDNITLVNLSIAPADLSSSPMVVYLMRGLNDSSLRFQHATYDINTSTWAITTRSALTAPASPGGANTSSMGASSAGAISKDLVVVSYPGDDPNFVILRAVLINPSTGAMTAQASLNYNPGDFGRNLSQPIIYLGDGLLVHVWSDAADDGFIRTFQIELSYDIDDDRGAETFGALKANNARSAEVHGIDDADDFRGSETTGKEEAFTVRGVEIAGQGTILDTRHAETHGVDASVNSHAAQVEGFDTQNALRAAEVHGLFEDADFRYAETHGSAADFAVRAAELSGIVTESASRAAEINGSVLTSDSISVELDGEANTAAVRAAELTGAIEATNARSAELDGQGSIAADRAAEIHGEATTSAIRAAELTGVIPSHDSRAAEAYGSVDIAADRAAQVEGVTGLIATRSAEVTGSVDVAATRGAELDGTHSDGDARGAQLDGALGLNATRGAELDGTHSDGDARGAQLDGALGLNATRGAELDGGRRDPYCPADSPYSAAAGPYTPYPASVCN
jgi:hypothetical protein